MTGRRVKQALWASLTLTLAGCAETDKAQLAQQLSEIREAPGSQPRIEIPHVPLYAPVIYDHSDVRSPFLAPDAVADTAFTQSDNSELAPDQARTPEPLERYALRELKLVGTLQTTQRQRALIQTPEGDVVSAGIGNYIGPDFGQITRITAQRIEISERVFTPRDGWAIREAELTVAADANADADT